jgi:4'-phosphopantetheinyl transferase
VLTYAESDAESESDADVVRDPSGQIPGAWSVRDLPVPDGCLAALAVAGAVAPRIAGSHSVDEL